MESYLAAKDKYVKLERVPEEYKHEIKQTLREKGYVVLEDHEVFHESSMLLLSFGAGIPIDADKNFKCFMEFHINEGDNELKSVEFISGKQFMLKKYACTEVFKSLKKKIPSCDKG